MADIGKLKTEIDTDPLARVYSGMDDAAVAVDMNTAYRDNWIPLTSSQIFEVIDATEFQGLSVGDQSRVDRVLGLGVDVQTVPGSQARAELIAVFGAGSTTIGSLATLANPQQSRASELGIGFVKEGHVQQARA